MSDYRPLFLKSFCLVTGLFLLSGCNDNNSGGTASSESSQVSSVMPADSTAGVSPDTTVTAAFAEDMLGTSISERTVRLSRNGNDVPAGVTFDGASNVVTLTPDSRLGLLGHYQFTLDASIANLSGNALSSPVMSSFTVRDGVWDETATSFNIQETNTDVQVATGNDGQAFAVWATANGNPVSSHYTPEEGWSSSVNLDGGGFSAVKRYPQIAIDNEGNAIAIWQTYVNNGSYSLSANRYTKDEGWGEAVTIGTAPIYLGLSQQNEKALLGFDEQGNALVIRAGKNYGPPGTYQVLANRYTKQSDSWSGETPIASNGSLKLLHTQFTITADGSAFATWVQESSSSVCAIQASRYAPGGGDWTDAEIVGPGLCASEPQIGADDEGNAIVVWNQPSGLTPNIWANRYSVGEEWGTARMIETDDEGASRGPQLAVTPKGDALVVWRKNNGMSDRNRASRYSQQSDSWSQPENISAGDSDSVESPRLALDVDGNALAVWERDVNGELEVRAARYAVDSGWKAPETISSDKSVPKNLVQIAVDSAGVGTAYWVQSLNSDSYIYSNRFD